MQYFTADDVKAFLEAARSDRFYALFLLAIETGTRPGEYLALQWKDVNFDAGTLAVRRSLKKSGPRWGLLFHRTENGSIASIYSTIGIAVGRAAQSPTIPG